jgi:hypothetical protein
MGELKAEMSNLRVMSPRKRVQLQNKLMRTLKTEIQPLSTEMQQILCDDLVTALQNRLIVLSKAKAKSG